MRESEDLESRVCKRPSSDASQLGNTLRQFQYLIGPWDNFIILANSKVFGLAEINTVTVDTTKILLGIRGTDWLPDRSYSLIKNQIAILLRMQAINLGDNYSLKI